MIIAMITWRNSEGIICHNVGRKMSDKAAKSNSNTANGMNVGITVSLVVPIRILHNRRHGRNRVEDERYYYVRVEGIGPSTSVLSGQRSTTELHSHVPKY